MINKIIRNNRNRIENKKPDIRMGIIASVLAGMCYGLYSAFISVGMNREIWSEWKGINTLLSEFVIIYIVGVLGATLNDLISAVYYYNSSYEII
ncbi:MAG: hypothetical protein Q4D53_01340 [Leptotrichiaceae bacterium]|nr:hypothetical protein [Leptotrichiaceae bacterium]